MSKQAQILLGDNLPHLKSMASESVDLIYIDPPFNTGKTQCLRDNMQYDDTFANFTDFLQPRLMEAHRILKANGSLFFHIDWREAARCRLLLDDVFGGPQHCLNEIIWAFDWGGRSRDRWPRKHNNIYWYAKDDNDYTYNFDAIDFIPYMCPELNPKTAKRGKSPTDVWWQTIVVTNSRERTGYPTQKPIQILDRIVRVHSNPDDLVLDFFAGSGTTGEAALRNGRRVILIDSNPDAVAVMEKRLSLTATGLPL